MPELMMSLLNVDVLGFLRQPNLQAYPVETQEATIDDLLADLLYFRLDTELTW